jgi:DNA end-binding protein Ku
MPHAIWKGAISFGLVYVPVALYPASEESGIDFDWLDKRTHDPVGYKRINKRTGKEMKSEDIVKGIKQADGDYVILSEDEIREAYPKSMQTIAIETFVKAGEISFPLLERPYFTAPVGKGDKVYALLREAMLESGVIGIARVVMHTKERLAALIPDDEALMLNTIRWASELRSRDGLELPAAGKGKLKEGELKMARQLIVDMTSPWKPEAYEDKFSAAIHALAAQRVKAGDTEKVTPVETDEVPSAGNVVDLTELLRRSLDTRKPAATAKKAAAGKAAPGNGDGKGHAGNEKAKSTPRKSVARRAASTGSAAKKVSRRHAA